jgi:glycosyltransferase involved in cell wall biosynthesis
MKFSVITPSFSQLAWLELCVASVADQIGPGSGHTAYGMGHAVDGSGGSWVSSGESKGQAASPLKIEHIVCDGGSEGIGEFKERMIARFPETSDYRLEFVIGPDAGMYDAINRGLRRASGDICSYLNCDEQLLPGSLAAVGEYFAKHANIDVAFGDTIVVGWEGEPLCYWRPYVPSLGHLAGATLNTLSCSTFFRRRLIEAGHLFEPQWKAVGDLRWIRGLLEQRRRMACVSRPLAAFTFLGDNLGAGAKARQEFEASRESRSVAVRWLRRGMHGLRKLFSGAYVRRRVTYDLFALSDPLRRRRFTCESLGWTWPGLAKSQ